MLNHIAFSEGPNTYTNFRIWNNICSLGHPLFNYGWF